MCGDVRTPRRQRLVRHLVECGERPVLVADGQDLDRVLEGFARLQPEIYAALGGDVLPIDDLALIDGGRR
jgi:hypothetical protein